MKFTLSRLLGFVLVACLILESVPGTALASLDLPGARKPAGSECFRSQVLSPRPAAESVFGSSVYGRAHHRAMSLLGPWIGDPFYSVFVTSAWETPVLFALKIFLGWWGGSAIFAFAHTA